MTSSRCHWMMTIILGKFERGAREFTVKTQVVTPHNPIRPETATVNGKNQWESHIDRKLYTSRLPFFSVDSSTDSCRCREDRGNVYCFWSRDPHSTTLPRGRSAVGVMVGLLHWWVEFTLFIYIELESVPSGWSRVGGRVGSRDQKQPLFPRSSRKQHQKKEQKTR